jgi:hypothetical protein
MGNRINKITKPVNYDCPKCMEKEKNNIPNLAGRFFIINETECRCNGCNTIFQKSQFYKTVVDDVKPDII